MQQNRDNPVGAPKELNDEGWPQFVIYKPKNTKVNITFFKIKYTGEDSFKPIGNGDQITHLAPTMDVGQKNEASIATAGPKCPLEATKGPNDEGNWPILKFFKNENPGENGEQIMFFNVKYTGEDPDGHIGDRKSIIRDALTLIDHFYVHLHQKRAMHAVDPCQRLKLLRYRGSKVINGRAVVKDRDFLKEMTSIFTELRDLHTTFILPSPYKNRIVFLPFFIEEFYEKDQIKDKWARKYMVSKIVGGHLAKTESSFKEGVEITHWNGIPIEQAVILNGERHAGSNECARRARGLESMTIRPLKNCLAPVENWVRITYKEKEVKAGNNDKTHHEKFCWYIIGEDKTKEPGSVRDSESQTQGGPVTSTSLNGNQNVPIPAPARDSSIPKVKAALGVDAETEMATRSKEFLYFGRKINEKTRDVSFNSEKSLKRTEPKRNRIYKFCTISRTNSQSVFAYFRIYSFDVEDEAFLKDSFLNQISFIENTDKYRGLIIDVRGNGGGLIPAAERLLQVFTPKSPQGQPEPDSKVEFERFQFVNTPLTLELCNSEEGKKIGLEKWAESIEKAIETKAVYSQGFTLTDDPKIDTSEKYEGPVVLITDALCYSATDIFAAGFQDNKIGKILGVHERTGAGGANVWSYNFLNECLENNQGGNSNADRLDFRVAIRRATRVGDKSGMPLEDLGVEPDCIHYMTRNDLINENEDLILKAIYILEGCNGCNGCKGSEEE